MKFACLLIDSFLFGRIGNLVCYPFAFSTEAFNSRKREQWSKEEPDQVKPVWSVMCGNCSAVFYGKFGNMLYTKQHRPPTFVCEWFLCTEVKKTAMVYTCPKDDDYHHQTPYFQQQQTPGFRFSWCGGSKGSIPKQRSPKCFSTLEHIRRNWKHTNGALGPCQGFRKSDLPKLFAGNRIYCQFCLKSRTFTKSSCALIRRGKENKAPWCDTSSMLKLELTPAFICFHPRFTIWLSTMI